MRSEPSRIESPAVTSRVSTRSSLTQLPLRLPRSTSLTSFPSRSNRACRRDSFLSAKKRSHCGSRPMISGCSPISCSVTRSPCRIMSLSTNTSSPRPQSYLLHTDPHQVWIERAPASKEESLSSPYCPSSRSLRCTRGIIRGPSFDCKVAPGNSSACRNIFAASARSPSIKYATAIW